MEVLPVATLSKYTYSTPSPRCSRVVLVLVVDVDSVIYGYIKSLCFLRMPLPLDKKTRTKRLL